MEFVSTIFLRDTISSFSNFLEILEHLINTYSLTPNKTVFLDDMQYNIEAAEKFGLETLLVKNPLQMRKELYTIIGI